MGMMLDRDSASRTIPRFLIMRDTVGISITSRGKKQITVDRLKLEKIITQNIECAQDGEGETVRATIKRGGLSFWRLESKPEKMRERVRKRTRYE